MTMGPRRSTLGAKMLRQFRPISIAASAAAATLLAVPSAHAAQPRSEALVRYVDQAGAICHAASRQLNREVRIGGSDPGPAQILRGFSEAGQTFLWESGAFHRLAIPRAAQRAGANYLSTFYKYAGEEMRLAVAEDRLGDTGQAGVDLRYSAQAANDAARVADRLGIRGCNGE